MNDGGPAFPIKDWHKDNCDHNGMTLRDYFSAKAMQSLLISTSSEHMLRAFKMIADESGVGHQAHIVNMAYSVADAMLKAREVKHE